MAGARALWRATGMKDDDFQKPIIAVVNSFTQFVPGHVHLKDMGQLVAREIEKAGREDVVTVSFKDLVTAPEEAIQKTLQVAHSLMFGYGILNVSTTIFIITLHDFYHHSVNKIDQQKYKDILI